MFDELDTTNRSADVADDQQQTSGRWLFFTFLGCLVLLALICLFGRLVWISPVYDPALFKVDQETTTLIAGASRSDLSFVTDQIPGSRSIALNAEPVFFTYHKLRHVLANNNQVKDIILATGPLHISSCQTQYLFGGDAASRRIYMAYYPFLDDAGKGVVRRFSEDYLTAAVRYDLGLPLGFMDDMKPVLNHYRGRYVPGDFRCWHGLGPFETASHLSLDQIKYKIDFYFYRDGEVGEISEVAVDHFEKLADLCKDRGVRLWLVKTPLHDDFRSRIPDACLNPHQELMKRLDKKHEHVHFLDYSEMEFPDRDFVDGDHLNVRGAKRFTSAFVEDFETQRR